jgi:hypothetical protein
VNASETSITFSNRGVGKRGGESDRKYNFSRPAIVATSFSLWMRATSCEKATRFKEWKTEEDDEEESIDKEQN